jgi:hypothetical protein
MPIISVGLVRKCHPEIDVNNLHLIEVIRLINQGIDEIDNLEVFSNIKALFLNQNNIKRIENLEYLSSLQHLDLSSNKIDSESLRQHVKNIPAKLGSINLSNNPCCEDEVCLQGVQDMYPNLNIIIGLEEPESADGNDQVIAASGSRSNQNEINDSGANEIKKEDENSDDEGSDEDSDENDTADADDSQPPLGDNMTLDADIILQQLVERKCRIQQLSAELNIDSVLSVGHLDFCGHY